MRFRKWSSAAAAAIIFFSSSLKAEEGKEYYIKAAFIYNFIKFTEWPAGKLSSLNVCVLGQNPFGKAVSVFKEAPKLAINVNDISDATQAKNNCHIVFVSQSETAEMANDLQVLSSLPILTVSDIDEFAKKGGIIQFAMQDNKIKFIVNDRAAQQAGLKLDAQLLEIALSVIH